MGLKIIRDGGTPRETWYGQYHEGGKCKVINLGIPIRGRIPARLTEQGDSAFEKSRVKAQAAFDNFQMERKQKGTAETLTRTLIESKTGRKVEDVRLDELPARWRSISRNYTPTKSRCIVADAVFRRFADFAKCKYLYEVTPTIAADFFNEIKSTYAWSTVKDHISLLKGSFSKFLPPGVHNPFSGIIKRSREENAAKVHRKPLTEEEVEKLFSTAKADPFLYPLTVCAACTGLRIGDVCKLEWESVDFANEIISLKTAKTGVSVQVPIFPLLLKELQSALARKEDGAVYVFPEACSMYIHNRSGISRRGKYLFAKALFGNTRPDEMATIVNAAGELEKPLTDEEVCARIETSPFAPQKKMRMIDTFKRYRSGQTYREIETETGRSRGQTSEDIHAIELLAGRKYIKGPDRTGERKRILKLTRQVRPVGKNSASLYDWHSLRATFVVLALQSNVALEDVRKVVGHTTTQTTLEYYNPTKKHLIEKFKRMKGSFLLNDPASTPPTNASAQNVQLGVYELAAQLKRLSANERSHLKALLST